MSERQDDRHDEHVRDLLNFVVRIDIPVAAMSCEDAGARALELIVARSKDYPIVAEIARDEPEQELSRGLQDSAMYYLHADGSCIATDPAPAQEDRPHDADCAQRATGAAECTCSKADEIARRDMPADFLEPPAIAREASEQIVARLEHDAKFAPVPQPVEVMQVAVVSTKHLSEAESVRGWQEWPTHMHASEYGFVVYVGEGFQQELAHHSAEYAESWPGLIAAAKWARAVGLEWVRFDGDANEQPGLPSFDW